MMGADPDARNGAGDTLLHAAVRSRSVGAVKSILGAGANILHKDSQGRTAKVGRCSLTPG
jgi:ankyrin repeat protein